MTDTPFGGMFGDIFSMLGQQGPDAWFQTATQLALSIARGEDGDPNALPAERSRLEELAPLVARHVDALFGVARGSQVETVNRSGLTSAALEQWKPFIEPLATATPVLPTDLALQDNPFFAQIASTLGPLFLGFQMGSVAGHFSERAWSLAAIPLPRTSSKCLLVVNNLKSFADAWSLEADEVYIFALAREFIASLVLSQSGTGDALRALLIDGVREVQTAQGDIMGRLQGMMGSGDMSDFMNNPASLLEGIEVPESSKATEAINAATGVLLAFFDSAAHDITTALLGPRPLLVEAYKRYRRTDARGEDAAAALFGISTQGPHHDEAASFVAAITEQYGLSVFDALLRVDGLPTTDELKSPESWYQRVKNSPLA